MTDVNEMLVKALQEAVNLIETLPSWDGVQLDGKLAFDIVRDADIALAAAAAAEAQQGAAVGELRRYISVGHLHTVIEANEAGNALPEGRYKLYTAPPAQAVPDVPFRMQNGPDIPWALARKIYAGYAAVYGTSQSLERINQRGGFGWAEVEWLWTSRPKAREAMLAAAPKEPT